MLYRCFFKRIIDFVIALTLFILLSLIFLIVFFLLLFSNKGQAFFLQIRPGKNQKLFKIIKFKTMNDKKDKNGELLPHHKRVTNIGRVIRKYSLDEIPQLINVIIGNMSLIGPRPLLPEYLPKYTEYQNRRHNVKPGITGWAQIHGRNATLFSERFKYDVWYVENISFFLDLKICLQTVKNVFFSEGVITDQKVEDVDDLGFNK